MIDVHCHLNFHAYEKDVDSVIKRAREKGVTRIINTGTNIDSSKKAVELAQKYDDLYAIVGIHPHHADGVESQISNVKFQMSNEKRENPKDWIKELERLARMPKVVGIGEIGMDFFSYKSNGIVNPKLQQEMFEGQIELAHKVGLPLQIHNRQAGKEVLEILTHHKNLLQDPPGMFHCFAGSPEILKKALDLGFYIGFDGNITYKGLAPGETTELKDLARLTPMDRILTETDSPFLTPVPFRGSQNEPSYVIIVGEFLAGVKGVSVEEINHQTEENTKKLFKIS